MKVICISGKAQHGKDTTAAVLKEVLQAEGNSVLITHYADLLKYICKTFFDWNGEKDVYGRGLLQHVGTDIIRAQNENYWVGFVAGVLKMFYDEWDYVLIPDCRFPNEIDYLKECGFEVTHMMVYRQNVESKLTEEQMKHPSETALDKVIPDIYVNNHGDLEDLRKTVIDIVQQFDGYYQMSLKDVGVEVP